MSLTDYRTLGRSGLRVSPLALGAMTSGDGSWGSARKVSFGILDRYLDAGGNITAARGRGLQMIDGIATRWGWAPRSHGKLIWARLDLQHR